MTKVEQTDIPNFIWGLDTTLENMLWWMSCLFLQIPLPSFQELKSNYPGYKHHGGKLRNHNVIRLIGCSRDHLLHDTSALRLSYAFNKVGGEHSLGRELIRLSKFGEDSVAGKDGLQYLYHPIAYGPFLADKYGYPSISKLHQQDPISTKKNFWGKQGILRVITYTKHNSNLPKGHVALWDCNHFHQSKDWIAGHTLITVEFWESPGECSDNANDITCYIFCSIFIYLEYWLQKESDCSKKYRKWSIYRCDIYA